MKVDLYYDDHGYQFLIKPENEIEKCAFNDLADKPTNKVTILITRLGLFKREVEKCE